MRGADVLAAPAFRARHRIEHLLPREVGDRPGTEPERTLVRGLEVERLEAAPRARPAEEDIDSRSRDVQVLRVREVREEAEDDEDVPPDEHALEHLGRRPVAEEVRDCFRDR
jgi:hypothetical protein